MNTDSFALRHIGPKERDAQEMLATIGMGTMEELIAKTGRINKYRTKKARNPLSLIDTCKPRYISLKQTEPIIENIRAFM